MTGADRKPLSATIEHARHRWIGQPIQRVEDDALLSGAGRYVDDLDRPGTLYATFVRAGAASFRIRKINTRAAMQVPGVVAVLTSEDVPERGLRAELERPWYVPTEMPLLASDVVRHVGEPIAMVLADSPYSAEDGSDAVRVELEPMTAVADLDSALEVDAPLVHADIASNVLIDVVARDDDELDSLLDSAAAVIEVTFDSGRVSALPLEARGCLAEWDERTRRMTLYSSTQAPHLLRTTAAEVLGLAEDAIRVVAPDVGGGFGMKLCPSREEILVAAAAARLRRTVKWTEDRRENLTAAFQGHEQRHTVRAGFAADGTLLGIDADMLADIGAYSCYPFTCGVEAMMAANELPGTYRLRHYRVRTRAVATNKPPMAPYRGVSRPQVVFIMERLMDKAAAALGLSRMDIRRRNLIADDEFPYRGVTGILYDRGSYRESLERCLEALDYENWPARQAEARRGGRLLGLGVACFSESTGFGTATFAARGMTLVPGYETAEIVMDPGGGVRVAVGASGHGQGHRTSLAQIVAEELGIDVANVRVVEGDTDEAPYGWGTFASRSAVIAGGASKRAAVRLREKISRIAAHLLEASPDDMELVDGMVGVRGSPRDSFPVADIARLAHHGAHRLPPGEDAGLRCSANFDPPGTYSNATHGAIVEVEPETGAVSVERYVVVEDCGVMLNPLIVEGQVRGGVAQGIGKALYERLVYDEQGQCQTGTLMDYLVPTAAEIPPIEILHLETPSEHSETGAKGMGEGGVIGAPATLANAVTDALGAYGVEIDFVPITPDRLRQALGEAVAGRR